MYRFNCFLGQNHWDKKKKKKGSELLTSILLFFLSEYARSGAQGTAIIPHSPWPFKVYIFMFDMYWCWQIVKGAIGMTARQEPVNLTMLFKGQCAKCVVTGSRYLMGSWLLDVKIIKYSAACQRFRCLCCWLWLCIGYSSCGNTATLYDKVTLFTEILIYWIQLQISSKRPHTRGYDGD